MKARRARRSDVLTFQTREWYERAGAEMRLAELLAEMKELQTMFAEEARQSIGARERALAAMKAKTQPVRHLTVIRTRKTGG